jgi:hypothetical protein
MAARNQALTTHKQRIHAKALQLLAEAPTGFRYSALHAALV